MFRCVRLVAPAVVRQTTLFGEVRQGAAGSTGFEVVSNYYFVRFNKLTHTTSIGLHWVGIALHP